MGNYYYFCDYCRQLQIECGSQIFDVNFWGQYEVCPKCISPFSFLLELNAPLPLPIVIENLETKELKFFNYYGDFVVGKSNDKEEEKEEDFKYSDETKYKFGVDEGETIKWMNSLKELRDFVYKIPENSTNKYYSAGRGFLEFQRKKVVELNEKIQRKKRKLEDVHKMIKHTELKFITTKKMI